MGVAAVLAAGLLLDTLAGERGWDPDGYVQWLGRHTTDYVKSGWYLWPMGAVVIWGLSLDWGSRSRRGGVLLLNRTAAAGLTFVGIAGSGILVNVLKQLIGRARPRLFDDVGIFHFVPFAFDSAFASFPSGHSATAGAVFAAFALLFPRLRWLALVLGVWFGFARIVVGAHYPSDVIAGLMLGFWFMMVMAFAYAKWGLLFDITEQGGLRLKRSFHLVQSRRRRR